MTKIITYGTFDMLHQGHINLLNNAKALGDYLIVGITSDSFDYQRGKINVQQTLNERIEAVKATKIADEIIIEEYEGQKIEDIIKLGIDIFTVGSDWVGIFDYLNEYCKVVYLPRTQGVSSTKIRSTNYNINLGIVGNSSYINKFYKESKYVNSVNITSLYSTNTDKISKNLLENVNLFTDNYNKFLENLDAVYIHSYPNSHYTQCKEALLKNKHVLCESPISKNITKTEELISIAKNNNCILMESIRTAYLTGYQRLLLLLKGNKIGKIRSVDATCTSLSISDNFSNNDLNKWGALEAWAPTALLPVYHILGTNYKNFHTYLLSSTEQDSNNGFAKVYLDYEDASASIKVGTTVKSESDLVISGETGYAYIPSPWWKTNYFELRYENSNKNKRYFYNFDGEGIRYMIQKFSLAINGRLADSYFIDRSITKSISKFFQLNDRNK